MFRPFRLFSTLVLLVAPVAAQSNPQLVGVTGVVQPLPGPLGCLNATHKLECTNVFLVGDPGVLEQYVGKLVKLFGEDDPTTLCNLVKVAMVEQTPPATLDWCGSPTIGCQLKFNVCPGGLSQFWLFTSLSPGFKPLNPDKGTWLLGDPAYLITAGTGGGPCDSVTITVPPIPGLLGLTFWLQGARRDIGPIGPIALTNAICLTIVPSTLPCVPPGC